MADVGDRQQAVDEAGEVIEGLWFRIGKRGKKTYYAREQVDGERYDLSLKTGKLHVARAKLDEFRKDPVAFKQGGATASPKTSLFLTAALRQEYLDYSQRAKADGGAGNTQEWVTRKRNLIKWWQTKLVDDRGRLLDLRLIPRDFIPTILDGTRNPKKPDTYLTPPATDRRTKRIVIKDFYAWLRVTKRVLTVAEDPVIDLPVGKGGSSIRDTGTPKDRVPPEHVVAVIKMGEQQGSRYAHVLRVQAGLGGCHTTEMMRLVATGREEPLLPDEEEEGRVAKLVFFHKRGREVAVKVSQEVLGSARVLFDKRHQPLACAVSACPEKHFSRHLCRKHYQEWQAGGLGNIKEAGQEVGHFGFYRGKGREANSFGRRHYENWVYDCCDKLGIPRFSPSWIRHTTATLARNLKYSDAAINEVQGRAADSKMLDQHYAPRAPKSVPTIFDVMAKRAAKAKPPKVGKAKPAANQAKVMAQMEALLAKLKAGGV